MIIQPQDWLINLLRGLQVGIDYILYKILTYVIQLIFDIANFNLSSSDTLRFLYTKIYVVLTVYMLFKLSFTFLNYIVNPEALSDDKQGVGKIIRNSVIMVILLMILPGIFSGTILGSDQGNLITRIQKAATPILGKILIPKNGEQVTENNGKLQYDNSKETSEAMALSIAKIFYHPAYKTYSASGVCSGTEDPPVQSLDDMVNTINDTCRKVKNKDKYEGNKFYKYSYVYVVSTIVTCFMIYLLVKMAIIVGKRTFKLIVLEIIFPIPVIMLIDPKAMESASSPFNTWLHSFISTFLELFFHLGVLYLFLNIIVILMEAFDGLGYHFDQLLLELALIISLLAFAGEAPAFVKKALGVKEEKSPTDEMGAIVGAAAGYGAAKVKQTVDNTKKTAGAALAAGIANKESGGSFGEGMKAGFKTSIGFDANKSMNQNIKDKVKDNFDKSAFGRTYHAVHNKMNNKNKSESENTGSSSTGSSSTDSSSTDSSSTT